MDEQKCYWLAQKYGLSPREARNFSQMTEEQRLVYLFSRRERAEKSNEAFKYKSRILAKEAEDAKNVARQEIDRLNRKAARLEHELSRKY
ncbi:MAG: hypothetical protein ACI4OE_00810 [Alphaproteobacteria bacterium]